MDGHRRSAQAGGGRAIEDNDENDVVEQDALPRRPLPLWRGSVGEAGIMDAPADAVEPEDPESDEDVDDDDDDDDDGDGDSTSVEEFENDEEDEEIEHEGFIEAVNQLEGASDGRTIDEIEVYYYSNTPVDDAQSFPRFVTLLRVRSVRRVTIWADWRVLREGYMERLFRDVLPGHPTLENVDLGIRYLPTRFLKLFTEAIPAARGLWRLTGLGFEGTVSHDEALPDENYDENVSAIADLLKRNAAINELRLLFDADSDQCKRICQSVHRNTHLRTLYMHVQDAESFDGLASSSLTRLEVMGTFSADAMRAFAFQLRTNEKLQDQRFCNRDGYRVLASPVWLDLVKTYNYTLESLGMYWDADPTVQEQLTTYLVRNKWIRFVLGKLQDPDPHRRFEVPSKLLAHALSLGSDTPTVLYRILRMGYVMNIVVDRLVTQKAARGGTTATTSTTPPPPLPTTAASTRDVNDPRCGGDPSSPTGKRRRTDP